MSSPPFTLRPYAPADEDAAIALWHRTWRLAYPQVDFDARLDWWRQRWRKEVVPAATITVAEADGVLVGFVTVVAKREYLDQIVVAPESWKSGLATALMEEAKKRSPSGLTCHVNKDNPRAIRFYEKHGFVVMGGDVNPNSRRPVYKMSWRPHS